MSPSAPSDVLLTSRDAPLTRSPVLVVVGAGPTAIGVLERLVANAPELGAGSRLQVHLVDPFPPGGGRVWRGAGHRPPGGATPVGGGGGGARCSSLLPRPPPAGRRRRGGGAG